MKDNPFLTILKSDRALCGLAFLIAIAAVLGLDVSKIAAALIGGPAAASVRNESPVSPKPPQPTFAP